MMLARLMMETIPFVSIGLLWEYNVLRFVPVSITATGMRHSVLVTKKVAIASYIGILNR